MGGASDCNGNKEEAGVSMDGVIANVRVDIPAGRVLHRVPPQLRENTKHIYDPVVLSLGPYHHGRTPQIRLAEKVKDEARDIVCGAMDKGFLLCKTGERMDEIRHYFYGSGAEECSYSDEELGEMMLRDACFVLCYIEMTMTEGANKEDFDCILVRGLGISGILFLARDFFMLENQIPFWFIKLVFSLTHDRDDDKFRTLLCNYLTWDVFGEIRVMRLPWEDDEEEEPLHLLEALILTSLAEDPSEKSVRKHENHVSVSTKKGSKSGFESASSPFRTVTELKAKGIVLEPSSCCMNDIRFISPKLQLPICKNIT